VMQSYSEMVDPSLRMADLQNLGSRLKLPAGWKFPTRILSESLRVVATGEARIVQDDLENTYQIPILRQTTVSSGEFGLASRFIHVTLATIRLSGLWVS